MLNLADLPNDIDALNALLLTSERCCWSAMNSWPV